MRDFDRIPGLGPYCELSEPVALQEGVGDEFFKQLVASWHSKLSVSSRLAGVHRATEGLRWLTANQVNRCVKSKFSPVTSAGAFLSHAPTLRPVSQYVIGTRSLMLLEPLALRPRIEEDISTISERLGAYAAAIQAASPDNGPRVEMFVYALPGVAEKYVSMAGDSIGFTSAKVLAVEDCGVKEWFIDKIKKTAAETRLFH
ncbi:MAG: hypothetical protein QM784_00545 [Polyangiaceae bacterium]